jgi:hypothetical protein
MFIYDTRCDMLIRRVVKLTNLNGNISAMALDKNPYGSPYHDGD